MKKLFLISLALLTLASCGAKVTTEQANNPYPTLPLGATGITLAPGEGENYEATGTEPFWGVSITATGVVFSRPGETGVITKNYETRQEEKDGITVIKDAKGEFFVTIKKGTCNDGMSDTKYEYIATVSLGSEDLKGCAKKK